MDDNNKEKREALGQRIREIRKEKKMTQKELGVKVGSSKNYISSVEGGKRNITFDYLCSIANALNVALKKLCFNI